MTEHQSLEGAKAAPVTRGAADYAADVARRPLYHDGKPRRPWVELDKVAQWSWERGARVGGGNG